MRVQPFWPNGSPGPVKVAIIGEAPGEQEEAAGLPFIGSSGKELDAMLADAGMSRDQCLLTNVISDRPPDNNLSAFGITTAERKALGASYPPVGPMIASQGDIYLHPDRLWELDRLEAELLAAKPNIIVAMGNTAVWAMLGVPEITKLRGTVHVTRAIVPGTKVLPTFHPDAVMRQWSMRPIVVTDLTKAKRESEFPEVRYSNAKLYLEPTLEDLISFEREFIRPGCLVGPDVETRMGEVVSIGFAPTPGVGIVVPFRLDHGTGKPQANYWPDAYSERVAWRWVERQVQRPDISTVWQNGLYDVQALLWHGIRVRNAHEDTMLMHHSLWPELPKDLGFLGSIYTNHPMWKDLAGRHADELKRDA